MSANTSWEKGILYAYPVQNIKIQKTRIAPAHTIKFTKTFGLSKVESLCGVKNWVFAVAAYSWHGKQDFCKITGFQLGKKMEILHPFILTDETLHNTFLRSC